jgi:hypothetical protein
MISCALQHRFQFLMVSVTDCKPLRCWYRLKTDRDIYLSVFFLPCLPLFPSFFLPFFLFLSFRPLYRPLTFSFLYLSFLLFLPSSLSFFSFSHPPFLPSVLFFNSLWSSDHSFLFLSFPAILFIFLSSFLSPFFLLSFFLFRPLFSFHLPFPSSYLPLSLSFSLLPFFLFLLSFPSLLFFLSFILLFSLFFFISL